MESKDLKEILGLFSEMDCISRDLIGGFLKSTEEEMRTEEIDVFLTNFKNDFENFRNIYLFEADKRLKEIKKIIDKDN